MKTIDRSIIFQTGHPRVMQAFEQEDNYLIEDFPEREGDLCMIYFSSNGFYFPNNENTFEKMVIKKKRFDWMRLKSDKAKKNIFVRDVFKQFYLDGINHTIDSPDKIFEFLKRQTAGMRVITVGGSSGGWAAVLFGIKLKAEFIYSFSGQFDLHTFGKRVNNKALYPLLYNYENDEQKNKYYDLRSLVKGSKVPIIWFLAGRSEMDLEQKELVNDCENVHVFMSNGKIHGDTIYNLNKKDVLTMPGDELLEKLSGLNNKIVSQFTYSLRISNLKRTIVGLLKEKCLYYCRLVRLIFWWGPAAFFTYWKDKKKIQKDLEGA